VTVITDYASLVQAVIDTAEDDGQEFANYIPTALDLAEEFLFRELDLPDLEIKTAPAVFIPGNVKLAKPTGYRYANYFKFVDTLGNYTFLKKRRDDFLQDYWPNPTLTAEPKYYADDSLGFFSLAPTPDATYAYEIKYTKQPTKLTALNTTNYFTDRCQDVLFYAVMVNMIRFMKAWTQIPIWEGHYLSARESWNLNMDRVRRDDGQTPHNLANGPNRLNTQPAQSSQPARPAQ
jgi:hypothetical protein